jgi:CO dehydrogenase/acetyl-CoA synthase gamma subunit (corrinoid Fe-S protein)
MLLADAYLDRIDFLRYLPQTDCGACGEKTCEEFAQGLKRGEKRPPDCPEMSESLYYPFQIALEADHTLPKFTCVMDPQPGPIGVVEINRPREESPLLISGNHVHTQDVLLSILSTTSSPFLLLFSDTKGNTVDMAVIFETLTAKQIRKDVQTSDVLDRISHKEVIIPGLAAAVGHQLTQSTVWNIIVGPICAAELPLFLADRWLPVGS